MHIDSIELFRLPAQRLPPDDGGPHESLLAVLSSGGTVGWGEAMLPCPPLTGAEWSQAAFACARDWLAPQLVGRAIGTGEELQAALSQFQGQARAKSALDVAWWNLAAQRKGQSLPTLLRRRM